jgi:hypothetical protein
LLGADSKGLKNAILFFLSWLQKINYSDSNRPIDTTVNLFDAEMRYLYDNGFKVLTMANLGYDEYSQSLYIKNS